MPARLNLYDDVAQQAAGVVVRGYSTSFGLATRLLGSSCRADICNVYALVRLADEVVDGAAAEAGGDRDRAGALLDALEQDTAQALASGYSTNLLVHAFARTARRAGFGGELTAPFFASMRTDLTRSVHDAASLSAYVYGSAEVVGLMCLRVFVLDLPPTRREAEYERLRPGARSLGAAFQKINFLRDLADDSQRLGRSYLTDVDPSHLTEARKRAILADIEVDLRAAAAAVRELPPSSQRAVAVAAGLFTELTRRLAATPAEELTRRRVRVPPLAKARVAALAIAGREPAPRRRAEVGS